MPDLPGLGTFRGRRYQTARTEERATEFERRGVHGGIGFLSSRNDLLLFEQANQFAADFARDEILGSVDDQKPYYSGKHKRHRANVQVLADPAGHLVWASAAPPGGVNDLTVAQHRRSDRCSDRQRRDDLCR